MNPQTAWYDTYERGEQNIRWPWSDVIGLTVRHARPSDDYKRVLELGFGSGANVSFFLATGFDYHGVECAENIVQAVRNRFPEISSKLLCADFTKEIPFASQFDLVVDRAALTHNTTEGMRSGIEKARNSLRPGGLFIGVDWFSTEHSEFQRGKPLDDQFSRSGYDDGIFQGLGVVHFCDAPLLHSLFSGFQIISLEHKAIRQMVPNELTIGVWNFVARKI